MRSKGLICHCLALFCCLLSSYLSLCHLCSGLSCSILISCFSDFSLSFFGLFNSITLFRSSLTLILRHLSQVLLSLWNHCGHCWFNGRNKSFVYDVQLLHALIKVFHDYVGLLHLIRVIGKETLEISPHLVHILREFESCLILVLVEIVHNCVQVDKLKPWFLLKLEE